MKKVVLTLAVAGFFSLNLYSQDDANKAIDLYNQALEAAKSKDYASAIAKAEEAYNITKTVPEGTEEVKPNLEQIIPQLYLEKAKKTLAEDRFDEAVAEFNQAAEEAKKLNDAAVEKAATESVLDVYSKQTGKLFSNNDFEGAVVAADKALAIDQTDAQIYLIKGVSLWKLNKTDEAIAVSQKTIEVAEATGKADIASKAKTQIVAIYTRAAATAQKEKKWADVVSNAEKGLEYNPESTQLLQLVDMGNLQQGVALATTNKTKACQFLKKVKNNDKLKESADQVMKSISCN